MYKTDLPKIAIIGRPNVGKSSLFNRILKRRKAIIDQFPGITRDRIHAHVRLDSREFILIDTGGMVLRHKDKMSAKVHGQSQEAIRESDALVFVCDLNTAVTCEDEQVAGLLKRYNKKTFLVVNKVDTSQLEADIHEFHKLGLGDPIGISALHNRGIDTLCRAIGAYLALEHKASRDSKAAISEIKMAVVGRPNVGKSSFINCLLDNERLLVDDQPGTTRDSIDIQIRRDNRFFTIIDTAGMMHKKKLRHTVEVFSLARSKEAIRHCDVVFVMIDAQLGLCRDDLSILEYVVKESKPCIVLANKSDLIKDTSISEYRVTLRNRYRPLEWIPVIFTSCRDKRNLIKAIDAASKMLDRSTETVSTPDLNKFLEKLQQRRSHPAIGRIRPKIYYGTQKCARPAVFIFFCSNAKYFRLEYKRFIERNLRAEFGFEGIPLVFEMKERERE